MNNLVHFTQYLLPHGDKREVAIEVTPEIRALAQIAIANGIRFECEILTTGQVSITANDPDHGDIAVRIVPNGPDVVDAVNAVIREAADAFTFEGTVQ